MSFKQFIYYCSLCGGWAAFVAWGFVEITGLIRQSDTVVGTALIAAVLGLLVASAIGSLDAIMNAVGLQRLLRVGVCAGVGLVGGFLGGFIGEALHLGIPRIIPPLQVADSSFDLLRTLGWMLVGSVIGAAIGVFDVVRGLDSPQTIGLALKKIRNGVAGGLLGGILGGLGAEGLRVIAHHISLALPHSLLATGLVVIGLCIGLFIGLAQIVLKEAWIRVESGRRAGRELILSKDETTVGRAESCDIGIFGDNGIEKLHARILLKNNRYLLADANTPGGTYLNEERITSPQPLKSGDAIRVGGSVLRFSERAKRK
jgi:hypothetical protein